MLRSGTPRSVERAVAADGAGAVASAVVVVQCGAKQCSDVPRGACLVVDQRGEAVARLPHRVGTRSDGGLVGDLNVDDPAEGSDLVGVVGAEGKVGDGIEVRCGPVQQPGRSAGALVVEIGELGTERLARSTDRLGLIGKPLAGGAKPVLCGVQWFKAQQAVERVVEVTGRPSISAPSSL